MDMNYLRQGCLQDAERSLRGLEQLQCLKLLCSVNTGSKQEAQAKWQNTACGIRLKNALSRSIFHMTSSLI